MVADRFEQLGLPRNKMNIAPCSFIDYSTTPDLKYMDKKNIIVFCSRMVQGKGIDLLLQAALLLQDKSVPEYEIVIMGDGPLSSYVSKKMAAFNLSQVLFQGFVTQPTKVMAGAKVFCSLQDNSNYPSQSLIEAMACECSIIATDVGDTRMLIDKEVGILIPPNSPDKLADAIAELLYDPLKCQALGRAARQRALKTMRVEKYMEFLEAIYTGDLSKNIGK
jgi:glycosyltransferase involved in cell wall biosynthesis